MCRIRRVLEIVPAALVLLALTDRAVAGSGYLISAPLSSSSGNMQCAVVNAHATKNAIVTAFVYDAACNRLSYGMNIPPGGHDAATLPVSPGSAICVIDLTAPANQVARPRLVAAFSALDASGQPTASLPVDHYQGAFTACAP